MKALYPNDGSWIPLLNPRVVCALVCGAWLAGCSGGMAESTASSDATASAGTVGHATDDHGGGSTQGAASEAGDGSPDCDPASDTPSCSGNFLDVCIDGTWGTTSCASVCQENGLELAGCGPDPQGTGEMCLCDAGGSGADPATCELGVNALCTCVGCTNAEAQDYYQQCIEGGHAEIECWASQVEGDSINCAAAEDACIGGSSDDDGTTDDEGGCTQEVWYLDTDGDGFGVSDDFIMSCDPVGNYDTQSPGDCCDADPSVAPGLEEWHSTPNACGDYDYDCSGQEEQGETHCGDEKDCNEDYFWWVSCPAPACGQQAYAEVFVACPGFVGHAPYVQACR